MRTLWLAIVLSVAPSIGFATAIKANWRISVYEGHTAVPTALVTTWNYSARKSSAGTLVQLGSGLWELPIRGPVGGPLVLDGRVSGTATGIQDDSATLRLQLWDTSGLPENSPHYRAYFQSDAHLRAGQATPVAFTVGDASQMDSFGRYLIVISLDALDKEP